MKNFAGMPVVVSETCVKQGARFFPLSRHRSARIHKKLVRRFGGIYRQVPTAFIIKGVLYAHPAVYEMLKAETKADDAVLFGGSGLMMRGLP